MSDFDREERAFREALERHGAATPDAPLEVAPALRRAWWLAGVAAAAVVLAVAVPLALGAGDGHGSGLDPADPSSSAPANPALAGGTRWLGFRDLEVQVPADWPLDDGPIRPDCVHGPKDAKSWGGPDHPYVEVATGFGGVPLIGCTSPPAPADLPSAFSPPPFGSLPFEFWTSHVTLTNPTADVPDGTWTYRGWTLTRRTLGDVQVVVLESPEDGGLAARVMSSARRTSLDVNGCPTVSDVQKAAFQVPEAEGVPDGDFQGVIAVCQYERGRSAASGLVGSRQIAGADATELVAAIRDAPVGGGPDRPENCLHDEYGDTGILLRFLPPDWVPRDVLYPEAYVYYDTCFGNGIVDRSGSRQLTVGDCRPLFAGTVRIWEAQSDVADLCWPS